MRTGLPTCVIASFNKVVFLGVVIALISWPTRGQILNDSTRALLEANDNPSNKALVYMNLFIAYRLNDLDSAILFAQEAENNARAAGDSLVVVRAKYAMGWGAEQKGLYDQAMYQYKTALSIARSQGFKDREKVLLNNLGIVSYLIGNYDDALEFHFQSLRLREQIGNELEIATSNNNIGLVYYKIKDFDRAIRYFERSLTIRESLNNVNGLDAILINLGLCYAGQGDFEKAITYFDRTLEICLKGCDNQIEIEALGGLGSAYYSVDELDKAEERLKTSNSLAESLGYSSYQVINLNYLAKIKFKQDSLEKSLSYLNASQKIALGTNYRPWIRDNFHLFGQVFSKKSDFQQAYQFQTKYDSLNSEIINEGIIKNLADIQADYLERENLQTIASQDEEISRRTTLLILSVIIIFLITVILFILYRINQLRKKANQQLSEANAIIEQQNKELTDVNNVLEEKVKERTKELKDTNAALLKSNTDLDNFIYKTSHDIRGPLATLQGMCNIALMDIEEPKSVDYFEKIGRTADRLNEILSKLLVINQINNSLITSNPIDVKRLIKDILIEYQQSPGANKIRVDNQVERMDNFKSDEVLLKIILNNLISNAYKFYNSSNRVDSWIRIDASQCNNGHVEFNVIDNGIGIDETAAGKIFEIFSKASEVSDSAGLGLYLVKLAVEKLDGTIAHSKTKEGYTQFKVELPHR